MALTKTHNRMIAGAVVNVLDYGADITGSVDSKAAIQAAFDSLPSSGGTVIFPKGIYSFNTVQIIDKENVNIDGQGSTFKSSSATASYMLQMSNTSSDFKRGGVWQDFVFDGTTTGSCCLITGGAWTNQEFRRIFSVTGNTPVLIKYENLDAVTVRNPSNFVFEQIWNKSFDIAYGFYYFCVPASGSVDNFRFQNFLHWSNQTPSYAIYFLGAGAQQSVFENIYGAIYSVGGGVIGTNSTIFRSRIHNVLMEGSQNNKATLQGSYSECQISFIVNYIDFATYSGNTAISGKLNETDVFMALLQGPAGYSTATSVNLLANSQGNRLSQCYAVADAGFANEIQHGKNDYIANGTYNNTYAANGGATEVTLYHSDYAAGDIVKVIMAGTSSGLAKSIEPFEFGDRGLGVIGSFTTEDWSVELTYQVFDSGGTKTISCHVKTFKDNACVKNEYIADRTFTANITIGVALIAADWTGSNVVAKTAYAQPLFNSPLLP
tara:strand:- start:55 stop:1530 length:1476 start_codon:yes stop_codon:yes gene_type:complete